MYRPYVSAAASSTTFVDAESTIRGLAQDLATAFNTGNFDQASALYAADGTLMPPNREQYLGQGAVERAFRELSEAGHQDLRIESVRVEHAGDMAIEIGRYTVGVAQANGTTIAERGKFVRAWRRLGAWRIIADCWNSSLPVAK